MKMTVKSNLSKQIRILSVDSSAFYTDAENVIGQKLSGLYLQRKFIRAEIKKEEKEIKKEIREKVTEKLSEQRKYIDRLIKQYKNDELFTEFSNNKIIRILRDDSVTYALKYEDGNLTGERKHKKKVVISMFESELTRTLAIKTKSFSESIIIVEEYYAEVSRQLINEGFIYKESNYKYFSSSAGQIRGKKMVFVKKELLEKHNDTLMCGLNLELINKKTIRNKDGGANVNKLLAYISLQASASTRWVNFDINRVLICPDLNLDIIATVDHIDTKTFEITPKVEMPITMMPTDGAGMCLPSVSDKCIQLRMPFVKGLVSPFDFRKWALEHPNKKVSVKDPWGESHDIIAEDIEMILCESMFKMTKYYNSWNEYKEAFIKNNSKSAICQVEKTEFENVNLGYQMIQNLNEMDDEEIDDLIKLTSNNILLMGRDKDVMLKAMGVTDDNKRKNYYQQALELMPSILSDTYSKEIIKDTKKNMVKNAKAGKIEVASKYLFACPDWWAYCDWLIAGTDKDKLEGLLDGEEVYSKWFNDGEEIDIMRSPSLYLEHGVRINKVSDRSEWFVGNGIHLSHKSILSKLLQNDYDGDQLVCSNEKTLVQCAKRHMESIVPLHYEMEKAGNELIDNDSIFNGLQNAFKANIGTISNNVSRVWDSEKVNFRVLKYLVMLNNFEIDFAKTSFRPILLPHIKEEIKKSVKGDLPHLFVYAKNKKVEDVKSDENPSTMNRLAKKIPNKRIHFFNVAGEFDYRMLMKNMKVNSIDPVLLEKYQKLDKNKWTMSMQSDDKFATGDNLHEYSEIRNELLNIEYVNKSRLNIHEIVDALVYYLYVAKESDHKTTLWSAFGDIIVENIKINQAINNNSIHSCECGEKFIKTKQRQTECEECQEKVKKRKHASRQRKYIDKNDAEF